MKIDIFEDARKCIDANVIQKLFPDPEGYISKGEYFIHSPIRVDNTIGSFQINLNNGLYRDFASGEKGDLIDLVSKAFSIELKQAAEKIISESGGVVPLNTNKPKPKILNKKTNADKFPPELPITEADKKIKILQDRLYTKFSVENFGSAVKNWAWRDGDGGLLFAIIRHFKNNKKSDIPYFYSAQDQKWHQGIPYTKDRPLFNLDKYNGEKNILIVEGQKCAAIPVPGFWVTTWSGGTNGALLTYWETIAKFEPENVIIWPDNDEPGRKVSEVIKKHLFDSFQIESKILKIEKKLDKWDLADAIEDGIDPNEFIKNTKTEDKKHDEEIERADVKKRPFKILGFTERNHYFLPNEAPVPICFPRGSITAGHMLELAPESFWFVNFPGKFYFEHKQALNWIIRESQYKGYYSSEKIRGSGVWHDGDRIVVNNGEHLITHDNKKYDYSDFETKFVYVMSDRKFGDLSGDVSNNNEGKKLVDLFIAQKFQTDFEAVVSCGWSLMAPFSSFLSWRPHIWITGRKEIGKSYLLENMIAPIVGPIAHNGSGKDTEAGIRRSVRQDGCPIILDETEPRSQEARKKLDGQIELARNASSDASGEITIAAAGGGVDKFRMRQSFCFSSIVPHLDGAAIASRFIICRLDGGADFEQKKNDTTDIIKTGIMDDPGKYRRRIFRLLPEIKKNSDFLKKFICKETGSQRLADNLCSIFAAVYCIQNDDNITEQSPFLKQVSIWLNDHEVEEHNDENQLLRELFECIIKLDHKVQTIGDMIYKTYRFDGEETYAETLSRYGIKYIHEDQTLAISYTNRNIKELLRNTFYVSKYGEILKRHSAYTGETKTVRIGSNVNKCVIFDFIKLRNEYFEENGEITASDIPDDIEVVDSDKVF